MRSMTNFQRKIRTYEKLKAERPSDEIYDNINKGRILNYQQRIMFIYLQQLLGLLYVPLFWRLCWQEGKSTCVFEKQKYSTFSLLLIFAQLFIFH